MTESRVRLIRWGLVCAAVALIAIGLVQGEALTVLEKGIRICMECIGIG